MNPIQECTMTAKQIYAYLSFLLLCSHHIYSYSLVRNTCTARITETISPLNISQVMGTNFIESMSTVLSIGPQSYINQNQVFQPI